MFFSFLIKIHSVDNTANMHAKQPGVTCPLPYFSLLNTSQYDNVMITPIKNRALLYTHKLPPETCNQIRLKNSKFFVCQKEEKRTETKIV